jgi:predicted PurR-regulated permease PerM
MMEADRTVWGRRTAVEPPAATNTTMLVERSVVLLLVGLLLLGVALVLRPFGTAILFALILAVATWPLRLLLVRAGLSPKLAATLLSLGGVLAIGLPMLAIAPRLAARLAEGASGVEAALVALPSVPPDWVARIPLAGAPLTGLWSQAVAAGGNLHALLAPYADWLRGGVLAAAQALADSAVQFLLAIIIAGVFWAKGEVLTAAMRDMVRRLGGGTAAEALEAAGGALRSVAYGVVGTAFIQAILMAIGARIAGVPAPVALGFLVLLLAISQIGALLLPLVWGGAAWWLFHQGDQGWGIFMLAWGLLFVTLSDNLIRPWLISRGVEMPLTLVILGVFGGFLSFGFLGLFVGPALLAIAFTLVRAWRGSSAGPTT